MNRTYGDRCKCVYGYCSNSAQCHYIIAICLGGCTWGYITEMCNLIEWQISLENKNQYYYIR